MPELHPEHIVAPVLRALVTVTQRPADAVTTRKVFDAALAEVRARAHDQAWHPEDVREAIVALVALVDERILELGGPLGSAWRREPLQRSLLGQNTLGDVFFERFEALGTDPARAHVVAVYRLVLELGFRGRLAVTEATERDRILRAAIPVRARRAPRHLASPPPRRDATWRLLGLAGGSVLLGLALWGTLWFDLRLEGRGLAHRATASVIDR